jgi:hypothetical protein
MQSKKNVRPTPRKRREPQSFEYETKIYNNNDNNDDEMSGGWPPKKYEHIKGTGYGTSWSPASFRKSKEPIDSDTKRKMPIKSNRSTSRSKSETRLINRDFSSNKKHVNYDLSNESVYYSSKGSLHGGESINKDKYYAQISDLKSEQFWKK